MTKTEQFYREELLPLAGVDIDDEGALSVGELPCMLDGKRLRLPTETFLANPDWETNVAFHPLSEIITRGESEVLAYYRRVTEIMLNGRITMLMDGLIRICADVGLQKALKSAQVPLTQVFPDADAKSLDAISKITNSMAPNPLHRYIKLNLKRGVDDDKSKRKAVVNFPFAEALLENEKTRDVFGVKLRKVDFNGFRAIVEYIFEDTLDALPEKYSVVGNPPVAPYLSILLKAINKIQKRINHLGKLFSPILPTLSDVITTTKCTDYKATIEACSGEIPTLTYNEGTIIATTATSPAADLQQLQNIQRNTGPQDRGAKLNMAAARATQTDTPAAPPPAAASPAAEPTSNGYLERLRARALGREVPPEPPAQPARGGYLDNLRNARRSEVPPSRFSSAGSSFSQRRQVDSPPWDDTDPYR